MQTVLATIHDTYQKRCNNPERQKVTWQKTIAPMFPPDLSACSDERPGVLLAREGGDLGCALLWIVQAALVRPFLRLAGQQPGLTHDQQLMLESITSTDCGALAHSELRDEPLTVTDGPDGLVLNGVKKYITAGTEADFILVTARPPEDEKRSQLIFLPANRIEDEEMEVLELDGLCTVSHGRLTLTNKALPERFRLPLAQNQVRKTLKVYGLIERSLIIEALLAYMVYLNHRLSWHLSRPPVDENILRGLLAQQTEFVTTAVSEALNDEQVHLRMIDLNTVEAAIENISDVTDALDLSDEQELVERVKDLRFIRSLW